MQLKNCKAKIVVVKLTKTAIKVIKVYGCFASKFHFSFRAPKKSYALLIYGFMIHAKKIFVNELFRAPNFNLFELFTRRISCFYTRLPPKNLKKSTRF